jgi:hypothetical protein
MRQCRLALVDGSLRIILLQRFFQAARGNVVSASARLQLSTGQKQGGDPSLDCCGRAAAFSEPRHAGRLRGMLPMRKAYGPSCASNHSSGSARGRPWQGPGCQGCGMAAAVQGARDIAVLSVGSLDCAGLDCAFAKGAMLPTLSPPADPAPLCGSVHPNMSKDAVWFHEPSEHQLKRLSQTRQVK